MSRFFPHAAYAEDQPFAHTILTTHVIYRGFQSGATIGIVVGGVRSLPLFSGSGKASASAVKDAAVSATRLATMRSSPVIRSAGVGGVAGMVIVTLMLPFYMRGKQEIEWQDRSWRLLANKGQVEVDSWSLIGTAAGLATMASSSARATPEAWKAAVGRAGVGSMVGVVGYMVWRHGINQGKWKDD